MEVLEIKDLCKKFGENPVIENLNLSIKENTIFGFIGQNGAGKTTTMRMIVGLLRQDSGSITVCGEKVAYGETKTSRFVGYLPDVPAFYNYMNAQEYLKLCGEITGLKRSAITEKTAELLKLVGLEKVAKKRIGTYSRGMKQRLGIAQALLNEPKLLICDEPTSALDPVGRKEILEILESVKNRTTVIFSTHVLADVERICDHVAILKDGKIALSGTLAEIKNGHSVNAVKMEFHTSADRDTFVTDYHGSDSESIERIGEKIFMVHSTKIAETQVHIFKTVYEKQIYPLLIELQEPTLESLFMEVVK